MKDYIRESRTHFDRQAATYDANASAYCSGPAKISCRDVENYLKDKEFDRLLDVGCGTGWMIDNLSRVHPAEYCGLDLSEKMLQEAERKNISSAEFVHGLSDSLPFGNDTFDVVTCIQSFHHYPDGAAAMREACRVLKTGGIYILSDTGIGGRGAWLANHIVFRLLPTGDCYTTDKEGIAEMMRQAGFEILRSEQLEGHIYTVIGRKKDAL